MKKILLLGLLFSGVASAYQNDIAITIDEGENYTKMKKSEEFDSMKSIHIDYTRNLSRRTYMTIGITDGHGSIRNMRINKHETQIIKKNDQSYSSSRIGFGFRF